MSRANHDERVLFWREGLRQCPRCRAPVRMEHRVENCRMDGDAYGSDHFSCTRCPFETDFAFDEQCNDGTPYYYETWTWQR